MSDEARKKPAIVIAGPTCSGKSALATDLAERFDGTVINADSMQVYRELRILTARPSPADEARVPHALYGVRPAAEAASVAWWRGQALDAMRGAEDAGRIPILCGGTGMYLAALTQGLADIPDPGEAARTEARGLLQELGPASLHARLLAADPATAARLQPSDSQRLARAWEVWRGTGRGLAAWLAIPAQAVAWEFAVLRLDPPRPELRQAIATRFSAMLVGGALEEVIGLAAQQLSPELPAMRACGVPELLAFLRGEITLRQAEQRAVLATGQYTKRQATWFRHQRLAPAELTRIIHARYDDPAQLSTTLMAAMHQFLRLPVDPPPPAS